MEYHPIERAAGAFQRHVALTSLVALLRRAFGLSVEIQSIVELGGGEYNSVFRARFEARDPVIVRVAPAPELPLFWHERDLMRHEHALAPYLAPIAPLIPATLMADFTHQLLDRDYLIQSSMPGERWADIKSTLSEEENASLWRQFARIVRTLADVRGEAFGLPYPVPRFGAWSETVVNWLDQTLADAAEMGVWLPALQVIRDSAATHAPFLDEISEPRLLHGDLWDFNLLVERREGEGDGLRINAVLDADRGAWGDPLADWTFFLLKHRASARERAIFWDEFGRPDETAGRRFRALVYEGQHLGKLALIHHRLGHADAAAERLRMLQGVATALAGM